MVGLLKVVLTFEFLIGVIVGSAVMYMFKPLVDSGLQKLFNQND